MFTAENHNSQAEKRRRTDASSLGQSPNTTDNHLESQLEKRRRVDQPPPPKSANKHEATNTPAKTSSIVAKGPTQSPPLTSTTTQTSNSTPTLRQATTEPPLENVVNTNMKAGDPSSLKQPQASPTSSSVHRKSSPPDGNNDPVSDRTSSADHIPSIDDKQVMLPPKQTERDLAESATGDYEPHLDNVAESTHRQKGSDENLPEKKSAKVTTMVSLDCGTSTGATKVFVTIAKNGNCLDTRFEVTQEDSDS
ncbi:hypothetical protein O988_00203 [Pseudogymnoascus sp. VKM F-3808]|nr:hypothetical protein O988_00203 [Pseudogymnoascus sp. VKM F-3808]